MTHVQIKNVPDAVHVELRRRSTARQMTVRDYVLDLITQDQALPTMDDWLDLVAGDPPVTGVAEGESARLIRQGRATPATP